MPIFARDRTSILFMHIPKTGGTTMHKVFSDQGFNISLYCTNYGKDSPYRAFKLPPQHMTISQIEKIIYLEKLDFAFTLIREPLKRFKSSYAHFFRGKSTEELQSLELQNKAVKILLKSHIGSSDCNSVNFENQIFTRQAEFISPRIKTYKLESDLDQLELELTAISNQKKSEGPEKSFIGKIKNTQKRSRKEISGFSPSKIILHHEIEDFILNYYEQDFKIYESS